jgi:hypothetical protein
MIDSHQGPDGKQHVIFPRTQATKLPEVKQVSLPSIEKLEKGKRINIWLWKRSVHSTLIQLNLEDVIDTKIPSPSENDPKYERWKSWSTVVRCWLLNQLDPEVIEDVEQFGRRAEAEVDLEDRLPRYADGLYTIISKAFMAGEEYARSNAAIAIHAIRREKFDSVEEYIEEWRKAIIKLREQAISIHAYVVIKLMFLDLRDEMPMTINMLEDKIDSESSVTHDRFIGICNEIIAKSKKSLDENTPI